MEDIKKYRPFYFEKQIKAYELLEFLKDKNKRTYWLDADFLPYILLSKQGNKLLLKVIVPKKYIKQKEEPKELKIDEEVETI